MFRFGVRILAAGMVCGLATTASAAHSETIRFTDTDSEAAPSYLDAQAATFSNSSKRVVAKVDQGTFMPSGADWVNLSIDVPGPTSFVVSWSPESGKSLSHVKSLTNQPLVKCRGLRVRMTGYDSSAATNGSVRIVVPQRCLKNTKRVRFSYDIGTFSATQPGADTLPDEPDGTERYTRWVKRG